MKLTGCITSLITTGTCLVELPKAILGQLETLRSASQDFFAQTEAIKAGEGYLDQRPAGFAVERYINRGSQPQDAIMKAVSEELHSVRSYFETQVALPLLQGLLKQLGLLNKVGDALANPDATLSLLHYPPRPTEEERIHAHTDTVLLTVLWAPEPGLQIKRDEAWQRVICPPGQVLVQVGNGLQLWANGKLPALEHRVVVEGNVDRYSIASFFAPNSDQSFVNLVTGQVIAETFGEYARMHVAKTYQKQPRIS